jgi:hypothetical protein
MTGQIQQHLMQANAAELLRTGEARRVSGQAGHGRRRARQMAAVLAKEHHISQSRHEVVAGL